MMNYSYDNLFDETIELSKKYYFNNNDKGVIYILSYIQKYISLIENEKAYEKLFFEIYTLLNRKKLLLEYISQYSSFKKKNYYNEFIERLKKNIANWDVVVVLLLKQSKRYNEKTMTRLVKKCGELIDEELTIIKIFDKVFKMNKKETIVCEGD